MNTVKVPLAIVTKPITNVTVVVKYKIAGYFENCMYKKSGSFLFRS